MRGQSVCYDEKILFVVDGFEDLVHITGFQLEVTDNRIGSKSDCSSLPNNPFTPTIVTLLVLAINLITAFWLRFWL
jgi:hypothetical protein